MDSILQVPVWTANTTPHRMVSMGFQVWFKHTFYGADLRILITVLPECPRLYKSHITSTVWEVESQRNYIDEMKYYVKTQLLVCRLFRNFI
ncbi:Hypothetical predicted protein [Pelobates cultripes]|uniref:Uncharacterized protein n=1 Tax=Pelobates cultripes TaxID=61616 RepID=A0AAD1VXB5_PELCU|nr:Hypothetical predicted protein [Pelobates cultripes]